MAPSPAAKVFWILAKYLNALPFSPWYNLSVSQRKALGAFYTHPNIAQFLVEWAVRTPNDRVLDPAFGGGVFLQAASQRLQNLGGHPRQVYGVEVDPQPYHQALGMGIPYPNLLLSDFFALPPLALPPMQAVVGNPPFIRYQRFNGQLAQQKAAQLGVHLSRLSSSWAPFVAQSAACLAPQGRLALVLPTELGHASYARPLLAFLGQNFKRITLITFTQRLFANLGQDTLLLLAEGFGPFQAEWRLLDLPSEKELVLPLPTGETLDPLPLISGQNHLKQHWLPSSALALYQELSARAPVLGDWAQVGIGYVTGANRFFHLSPQQAQEWQIPTSLLLPIAKRGRSLRGLQFSGHDWQQGLSSGETGYLLNLPPQTTLPPSVQAYLEWGQSQGFNTSYKCRTRQPWYSVPSVKPPHAFLSYMSGQQTLLCANPANAAAPNSLLVVNFYPQAPFSPLATAALWHTSFTQLSIELQGHALGGGMHKLEPSEAGAVRLWPTALSNPQLEALALQLDALLRQGQPNEARRLADDHLLQQGDLSHADVKRLQEALVQVRQRRLGNAMGG